jgi:ZIP family zinc transporter
MSPYVVAALYGLIGGILGNLLAAFAAVTWRRQLKAVAVGTALGVSAGFIVATAFLDLTEQALVESRSQVIIGLGIALGVLLMVGLELLLGAFGAGEDEAEARADPPTTATGRRSADSRLARARLIAIGEGIHNIPEALPIGAALAVSPHLGLLIALLMTVENFAESGAIAAELVPTRASAGQIYGETIWPGLLSVIGAPIGVLLAGISPTLLALTLALAAGIMLVITGDVWGDGRRLAGPNWSSIGVLLGVLLAVATAVTGSG